MEDHAHAFTAFVASMLADFDRYLATNSADPVRDGAVARVAAMWLTDGEFMELARDLSPSRATSSAWVAEYRRRQAIASRIRLATASGCSR